MRGRATVAIVLCCVVVLAAGACDSERVAAPTVGEDRAPTTGPAGVPLREILERLEAAALEESAGYYSSYRLEPCFARSAGSSTGEPLDRQAPIGYGGVVECGRATDPPGDSGELWVVVLDDRGTVATWSGGTGIEAGLISDAPAGLLCREFLAQPTLESVAGQSGPDWPSDSSWAYIAVLAYWFIEGQPTRMDVDDNGIPCELLFDPAVVAAVWEGGT